MDGLCRTPRVDGVDGKDNTTRQPWSELIASLPKHLLPRVCAPSRVCVREHRCD